MRFTSTQVKQIKKSGTYVNSLGITKNASRKDLKSLRQSMSDGAKPKTKP